MTRDMTQYMNMSSTKVYMTYLHSYQPTVEDIMKVSTCDLFIYVGGELDGDYTYPEDYPSVGDDICVVGILTKCSNVGC